MTMYIDTYTTWEVFNIEKVGIGNIMHTWTSVQLKDKFLHTRVAASLGRLVHVALLLVRASFLPWNLRTATLALLTLSYTACVLRVIRVIRVIHTLHYFKHRLAGLLELLRLLGLFGLPEQQSL